MIYKKQWKEWFDGGNTIWSEYGYDYHSYKISSELLPTLNIPKEGDIIQFGCGVGVTIEKLCELYGSKSCLLYTSPSPRDRQKSRMPSSA